MSKGRSNKQHFAALVISHQFFLASFPERLPCSWLFFPGYEPISTLKHVYMTFKAVSDAAPAFQFFFSCHMSCRMYNQLSSYRSCAVVHGNVLDNWRTIAYNVFWNYSKEEKTILVVLLTQSKTSVASLLQWGKRLQTARFFVNDRHKGLLTVLPFHFPVSKHLYRVVNTFFKIVSFEDDI